MDAPTRVVITFEGEGAGRGPLSWGQLKRWQAVRRLGHWLPLGGARAVPTGTTIDDLADELRFCLRRYVTLRTRLHVPPGDAAVLGGAAPDASGTLEAEVLESAAPEQEVFASGTLEAEVIEGADPEAVAEEYRRRPSNLATEWPVRAAIICRAGAPTHLVLLISGLAMDPAALRTLLREAAERPAGPAEGLTPLDLSPHTLSDRKSPRSCPTTIDTIGFS
ncbi:hypothetical protein [Dactylosporangium sp. CA-092794]|uniref:hypothetical protein n=1 Tax=Dactylosporangium sp. CA-092794 TaxID=3239929 RepID=UPI003D8C7CD7